MRRALLASILAALALLALAGPAQAAFGVNGFDVTFTNEDGTMATQAGSHPFAMTTSFAANLDSEEQPEGWLRDFVAEQVPGFVADTTAFPRCTDVQFLERVEGQRNACPSQTAVGVTAVSLAEVGRWYQTPIYNLTPPPGVPLSLGFTVAGANVVVNAGIREEPPYLATAASRNTSQVLEFIAAKLQLWGEPSDPRHNGLRGACGFQEANAQPTSNPAEYEFKESGDCPVEENPRPFLTLPTSCAEPLLSSYEALSWEGDADAGSVLTHDAGGNPAPFAGCGKLGFSPSIAAQPTSKAASSPTGLDFSLDVEDEGLTSVGGLAQSQIRKAEVTLPEGMSANPSIAEGLEVCSMADLEAETLEAEPGEGCPDASKIGSLEVESPLVEEAIKGALFQAKPYDNFAENSLIAFYIVFKNKKLGIIVKQPAKVIPDPVTGQLTTVTEEMPQLPFSQFRLHFREGTRSPLTTPQACGSHDVKAVLTPWSGGAPVISTSTFQVISGPNEGPCPSGGLPPFKPGLIAGTTNNRAASFSPFSLRLFRNDSEQEVTHFSIKLPPGITGKLAGIPYCPDAAIEAAKARTGPHGGQEELDSPSCPAASEIGRTLAGAGVGPALTYAPGKVYLAGPYHGSNLSMVAITAGVVGPFDIGTVVIREAFQINPETAEVFIDSTGSDPIPHIIRGIPVHLRDIRAYVDRPEFVLNPTDCTATSTASTVLGSGLDFVSEADDNPITVTSRFQAADCAALTFAPRLTFKLIGGTKRGKFPKLVSHLSMNGIGESGIANASVILPRSEFIEQGHFNNICTRVQFKEGAGNGASCPAGSIYGHARAVTPILSEPLEGPVMLRSNPERTLPDVVAALHNAQVDFDLVGNVDSVKGQLRTTFASAPDAPVTSFDLELEGGAKGLFVNSTNLCLKKHRAVVGFGGQNGKQFTTKPLMQVKCKGKAKKARRHRRG